MRFIFLLLLTFTSAFAYFPKDINLNDYEYNRFVRPQLINISQDYITLINLLNPELSPFKPVFYEFKNLNLTLSEIHKICVGGSKQKCEQTLSQAKKSVKIIMDKTKDFPELTNKEHYSVDHMLESRKYFQMLKNELFSFHVLLENFIFFKESNLKNIKPYQTLEADAMKLMNTFYTFIHHSSDTRFRNEFISFWNDFYKVVVFNILTQKDKEMFIRKVNDLNLRLNMLNVVLTKRNHQISKQTSTLLKVVHRRWNNVLKVTLRK